MNKAVKEIRIRSAVLSDCAQISEIYNYYVLNKVCTFQEEVETLEDRISWLQSHEKKGALFPVIVSQVIHEDNSVVLAGWASLSSFRERSGYRFTVEDSIYIHHEYIGIGVGSKLLEYLVNYAKGQESIKCIMAVIAHDETTEASERIHTKFGFEKVGHLKLVGRKFNRWIDVLYYELLLR